MAGKTKFHTLDERTYLDEDGKLVKGKAVPDRLLGVKGTVITEARAVEVGLITKAAAKKADKAATAKADKAGDDK